MGNASVCVGQAGWILPVFFSPSANWTRCHHEHRECSEKHAGRRGTVHQAGPALDVQYTVKNGRGSVYRSGSELVSFLKRERTVKTVCCASFETALCWVFMYRKARPCMDGWQQGSDQGTGTAPAHHRLLNIYSTMCVCGSASFLQRISCANLKKKTSATVQGSSETATEFEC